MKSFKRAVLSLLVSLGVTSSDTSAHAEDKWGIATGTDHGKPLIYRYILSPPEGVNIAQYPDLIAVIWKFDGTIRNGMPEPKTNERMVQLEQLLEEKLERSRNAFMTVSVTGNGRKEWQWYSRDVGETMKLINEALTGHVPFPIQISRQADPNWSAYFDIVKAVK